MRHIFDSDKLLRLRVVLDVILLPRPRLRRLRECLAVKGPRSGRLHEPRTFRTKELDSGGMEIVIQLDKEGTEWFRKDQKDLRELGLNVSDDAEAVKALWYRGSSRVATGAKERRRKFELAPDSEDESPVVH